MPVLKEVAVHIITLGCGRGQNVTLIGAMALRGLVGEITFPGATDALAFKTYVTQVLVPNLWTGACVIMDNLPAHKVKGIREAIESVRNFLGEGFLQKDSSGATVVYLSPYCARVFAQARKLLVKG